jgi:hypothetical protein
MNIDGITTCCKRWRCICVDRKHPDGKRYLVLVDKGTEEICIAVDNFVDPVKSQWFNEPVILIDGGL